jgi:hypothetical protein
MATNMAAVIGFVMFGLFAFGCVVVGFLRRHWVPVGLFAFVVGCYVVLAWADRPPAGWDSPAAVQTRQEAHAQDEARWHAVEMARAEDLVVALRHEAILYAAAENDRKELEEMRLQALVKASGPNVRVTLNESAPASKR